MTSSTDVPTPDRARRFLITASEIGSPAAMLLLAGGLALTWGFHHLAGGSSVVPPHGFYAAIGFAALRFGLVGALGSGVGSALLAGPLLQATEGSQQLTSDWVGRGVFFVLIGMFLSVLSRDLRRSLAREVELSRLERSLRERHDVFVRNVSHELRTPLTILIGGLVTLRRLDGMKEERTRLIEDAMRRAVERLEQLVEVLLAASQLRQPSDVEDDRRQLHLEAVDLHDVTREIVESLGAFNARERVVVRSQGTAKVFAASNPLPLRVALSCLIENALKFSGPAAPVLVEVDAARETVTIRIVDEGEGIHPDFVARIGEPFEQWDRRDSRAAGGLGIGLFVAKGVIEMLGGRLQVRPAQPSGTEAVVVLPQRREADQMLTRVK